MQSLADGYEGDFVGESTPDVLISEFVSSLFFLGDCEFLRLTNQYFHNLTLGHFYISHHRVTYCSAETVFCEVTQTHNCSSLDEFCRYICLLVR